MSGKLQENKIEKREVPEEDIGFARVCLNSIVSSATILINTNSGLGLDVSSVMIALNNELKKLVKSNDTSGIEKMLLTQAYTLQSIFTHNIGKAMNAEYMNHLQIYSKIALKAQNQCRQTLTALAGIKNPNRTTFIKNQATNQQVNFNNESQTFPEKKLNQSNELLSEEHHASMDITGTATTSGANKEMATMEK